MHKLYAYLKKFAMQNLIPFFCICNLYIFVGCIINMLKRDFSNYIQVDYQMINEILDVLFIIYIKDSPCLDKIRNLSRLQQCWYDLPADIYSISVSIRNLTILQRVFNQSFVSIVYNCGHDTFFIYYNWITLCLQNFQKIQLNEIKLCIKY